MDEMDFTRKFRLGDPTYITNHNNARALIRKVDRDELLQTLVKYYLTH